MRQLVMNSDGVAVVRVPRPTVERGSVLVRVHYSFVSVGTEVAPLRSIEAAPDTSLLERGLECTARARHYFRASLRDPRKAADRVARILRSRVERIASVRPGEQPSGGTTGQHVQGWTIGYSASGRIVAVGDDIHDLAVGDMVACAGAGQANHADYVNVRRNLVCPLPPGCDARLGASATIGAIAMQGVRRTAPQLGERVVVIGLGLIGQIAAQLLAVAGCDVVGFDLDASRVARARKIGMAHGASDPESLKALVRDLTRGSGADHALLTAATRSHAPINLAMDITRAKGRVVIVGDVGLKPEREAFYRKEIDLLMSTSYGPGRYDAEYEIEGKDYPLAYVRWTLNRNLQSYLDLVAGGRVDVAALIDRVASVDDAPAVYRTLAERRDELPLGVVFSYASPPEVAHDLEATRVVVPSDRRASAGQINYALVGPGGFATGVLVPQMDRCADRFFLKAVVSRGGAQGANFARSRGVEVLTSNLDDVLTDTSIGLIVIATRHNLHADQVIRSLKAGKHVFVEKPLAVDWDGLTRVADAYEALSDPPALMVGFNRRFSPPLSVLAKRLEERRSPLVIEYRVNAGYLAPGHWVHGPDGGGRNIGEACHMYDVFRFLAGAPPRSISATPIDPGSLAYARNDNFSATIGYEDGTVATLVYTALGPAAGMGKEHITVFCDGDAYLLDDFRRLTRAGNGETLWHSSEALKGHFEELSRFGESVARGEPLVPFAELLETSAVALQVEDLLFGRESEGPAQI
jgi:predicted dehydrogenase